jgi:FKBP-type peptidyl-prolyl cis-trans isomerase SlyD
MATKENKYVNVAYKLYTIEDGEKEMVEEATAEHPFQFISGLNTTIDAFENEITKLNKGDKFDFVITKDNAYGEYNEEHVFELQKKVFEIDGKFDSEHIVEGAVVPLMDNEGHRMNGAILEVGSDTVKVDLNHPLAGADLNFVGEVVELRDATNEEIQGMINMMSGEGGCSCGCDSCGGDCEGGCSGEHCH